MVMPTLVLEAWHCSSAPIDVTGESSLTLNTVLSKYWKFFMRLQFSQVNFQ